VLIKTSLSSHIWSVIGSMAVVHWSDVIIAVLSRVHRSFSIASGLIAGKEGPFIHIGAIIGAGVSSLGSQSLTRWGTTLGGAQ
jgi:H+/Cl- antiporter ClcA